MSLESEIEKARKEIVSDGYDMSFGEVINLYRDDELIINPEFQRLFRWGIYQKTRFIESLLLGIPIPPIFVFQNKDGVWELIDGLQRLSTVLEFAGKLKNLKGKNYPLSILEGTKFLPSLTGKAWEPKNSSASNGIGKKLQLAIKRARIRVEILKKESDPQAKYELFQRLNTGGSNLSEQEVRNCIAVMINPSFHSWLIERSSFEPFLSTISQTDPALKKQTGTELVLRFLAFRNVPYEGKLDVHEYLDDALLKMAQNVDFPYIKEKVVFEKTFTIIHEVLGDEAFKKWDGTRFSGMFLQSVFEVMTTGISKNLKAIESLSNVDQKKFIVNRAKELWKDTIFTQNSGAGVRGTTRLLNLIPMAKAFFRP